LELNSLGFSSTDRGNEGAPCGIVGCLFFAHIPKLHFKVF